MTDDPQGSSRRRFLGTSLAATTAVLAGWRPIAASALGANDRIRVGVIGTGGRARGLMKQLKELPGQEIVAVCDVYEPRLLEAADITQGKAAKLADYRRILDDKDVHAVLIGAPDHWHKTLTLDALAAGKDVYLEKPVSHSIEEGEAMVKAVEASSQIVQTGTQQRSWEHWILGKQIIDSGKLGRVTFVNTYWYQLATPGGLPSIETAKLDWKQWLGPAAADLPFDAERFLRWRHFKPFGGGVLTDLLTHWIDVVHWYMGVEAPLTASTLGRNYRMKTWEWPDAVTATLEYPKDFMVTHTGTYGSSIDDGGLEFRGDLATLKIDRERLVVLPEGSRSSGRNTPEPEILVRSQADGSISHLRNWLDCVRSRKAPAAPMRVGQQAARAAHIANAALPNGRVRFDAKTGKVEAIQG